MLDATEVEEIGKFLEGFVELVKALQPDNYVQILSFCEDFQEEIIDLLNQVEELAEGKCNAENDHYVAMQTISDLEYRISDLENELSSLNSAIYCLEHSKGRSRY